MEARRSGRTARVTSAELNADWLRDDAPGRWSRHVTRRWCSQVAPAVGNTVPLPPLPPHPVPYRRDVNVRGERAPAHVDIKTPKIEDIP